MTIPQRITVKYFLEEAAGLSLPAIVPIFQRWIQEHRVEGLLIDVADYKHVYEGPGVVLIGHEVDYAIDLSDGRPGLLQRRKRLLSDPAGEDSDPRLEDHLRKAFRSTLGACQALSKEDSLKGRIHFRTDEVEITFPDRLRTPNQAETFEALQGAILEVLAEVYPGTKIELERAEGEPRGPLTVQAKVPEAVDLDTLVARIESAPEKADLQ